MSGKMTLEKLAHMTQEGFLNVDRRFDDFELRVNLRFEAVDRRFDTLENRFDIVEKKLDYKVSYQDYYGLEERVAKLEKKRQ